jgi:cytosine/adenosine deaminase-related metal-dependent hydrolase
MSRLILLNASLHGSEERYDVTCVDGKISRIDLAKQDMASNVCAASVDAKHTQVDCEGSILLPSLCHAHVHLDKCFLLDDTELEHGSFEEALSSTNTLKRAFDTESLLKRGSRLIEESIASGVTDMRCMVEVDPTVKHVCLDAGLALKKRYKTRCSIQIVVFAQDAIYKEQDKTDEMLALLDTAAGREDVYAIGSAPYVEKDYDAAVQNIRSIAQLAKKYALSLDYHLDYDLDAPSMLSDALDAILEQDYRSGVTFGHCTKLSQLNKKTLQDLVDKIEQLPFSVHLVGLPASDLFMMGRSTPLSPARGTMMLPAMAEMGFECACSINNCFNAFQPHGSCDPLAMNLSSIYQTSTSAQLAQLYHFLSDGARQAISKEPVTKHDSPLSLRVGSEANLVVYSKQSTIQQVVCMPKQDRVTIYV